MFILDPFYGVSAPGRVVSKWMNRILLLSEIAVTVWLVRYQLETDYFPWYFWLVLPIAFRLVFGILHGVLRFVWNMFLVILFGSTNVSYKKRRKKTMKEDFYWRHERSSPIDTPLSGLPDEKYSHLVSRGRSLIQNL
jgi:hypothetical protein